MRSGPLRIGNGAAQTDEAGAAMLVALLSKGTGADLEAAQPSQPHTNTVRSVSTAAAAAVPEQSAPAERVSRTAAGPGAKSGAVAKQAGPSTSASRGSISAPKDAAGLGFAEAGEAGWSNRSRAQWLPGKLQPFLQHI